MKRCSLPRVCLIEDDPIMGESLQDRFGFEGFEVHWLRRAAGALDELRRHPADLLICDIRLPDRNGIELFRELQDALPRLPPCLFITGHGTIEDAVTLLQLGAVDYVTKPFSPDELIAKMRAALPVMMEGQEACPLGVSLPMRELEATLQRLAHYDSSVLISGESGVGKEVVARRLHALDEKRAQQAFIAVNCAALPEGLAEAELFGHEKGAFTHAVANRRGLFELAHGGFLFLDEIAELPLLLQSKLLRVIQERRIQRLGGERSIPVDVRLVCATHRDLRTEVERGRFREDLYYRINVIQLPIPPLRERPDDIPWLVERFLDEHCRQYPEQRRKLSNAALRRLLSHDWPGNVRELRNCIERACVLAKNPMLEPDDLLPDSTSGPADHLQPELAAYLATAERDWIEQSLYRHDWRIADTAQALGISRKNLWEKMRKLGIRRPV